MPNTFSPGLHNQYLDSRSFSIGAQEHLEHLFLSFRTYSFGYPQSCKIYLLVAHHFNLLASLLVHGLTPATQIRGH